MKKKKYTKESLIKIIQDFYKDKGVIPNSHDFNNTSPTVSTFYRYFGNWENVIKSAGLNYKESRKFNKKFSKEELIEFLLKYYEKYNKVPTVADINKEKDYPSQQAYFSVFGSFKNALIDSGLFDLRKDKHNFDRDKTFTREECLRLLNEYVKRNNKLPTNEDLKQDETMPSNMRYHSLFGGLNNALIEIGYKPKNIREYTDKELLSHLKKLEKELNKAPTCEDIDECEYTPHSKCYIKRFGSLYTAYSLAEINYELSVKQIDDEVLIDMWQDLKEELNRVPTIKDIENSKFNFFNAIKFRWNSYNEFLSELGEEQNFNKYNCRYYLSDIGKLKCSSYGEYIITNYLEKKNISFNKEVMYKNVIQNDKTFRRFDWVIQHNENIYYVELFGMTANKDYIKKAEDKIKTCKKNNINLVAIYPSDLKEKPLEEIFSFLW